ncbi:MAG: HD domain-containing protein [Bacillota bacterium]
MDRLEIIKEDPFYLECLLLNGERERDRLFCRHDYRHMLIVSQISFKIINDTGQKVEFIRFEGLAGPREAMEVIYAAGLLHDIGRWRQYDSGEDHAIAGSKMARAVLERARFSEKEIELITRAIREHRRAAPGQSLLGRVICLADDLSRPCTTCKARLDCYKYKYMENIREKNMKELVLGTG